MKTYTSETTDNHHHKEKRKGLSLNPPINGLISPLPVQRNENKTGMPDNLKSGIESLSGMDMSDVMVHYNSSQPAQLNAHAYAQGNQIHLAPGQEKHLPHEAWHVVQQKQGRVKPTMQLKDKVEINDDVGLEKEADVMGLRGLSISSSIDVPVQSKQVSQPVVQGVWGWLSTATNAVTNSLPSGVGDVLQSGSNAVLGWASQKIDNASNRIAASPVGQYFGAAPGPVLPGPVAAPPAAQNPSEIRKHYGAWWDALKYLGSAAYNWAGGNQNTHPLAKVGAGILGGLVGAVGGGLGSLGYLGKKAISGTVEQTGQALNTSDQITNSFDNYFATKRRTGAAYSKERLIGELGVHVLSPLAKVAVPPAIGLLSGTVNPTTPGDFKNDWKGAAPETVRNLTGKNFNDFDFKEDGLSGLGSLPHALLAGGLQTLIGTGAGLAKGTQSAADKISGIIGPGPIASLTLSTNIHSILKDSHGSTDATQSADTIGAFAQVASAPWKILSGAHQWLTNRDTGGVGLAHAQIADQALNQREGANTFSDGFSNLIRGGAFLGQELTKGLGTDDIPGSTIGKLINNNPISSTQQGWGYASPAIYLAHHLWRTASALGQRGKIETLPSYTRAQQREDDLYSPIARAPAAKEDLAEERIATYAHNKSTEKAWRNFGGVTAAALGIAGSATSVALLPVLAGLVGGGIGAYRLAKYVFSNDREERTNAAKYITEQLDNYTIGAPTPHDLEMERIAKVLESADVVDKFKGHLFGVGSNQFDKMQGLLYNALESW